LLCRLLGLLVVALTLQELKDLILADVHARFPPREIDDRVKPAGPRLPGTVLQSALRPDECGPIPGDPQA
jgi:hypothetical protein